MWSSSRRDGEMKSELGLSGGLGEGRVRSGLTSSLCRFQTLCGSQLVLVTGYCGLGGGSSDTIVSSDGCWHEGTCIKLHDDKTVLISIDFSMCVCVSLLTPAANRPGRSLVFVNSVCDKATGAPTGDTCGSSHQLLTHSLCVLQTSQRESPPPTLRVLGPKRPPSHRTPPPPRLPQRSETAR